MILPLYLDGKQPGKIDLCNGFGHRLVLYASTFRFDLIQFICWPHQVKHFVIFQQSVAFRGNEKQRFKLIVVSAPSLFMPSFTEHIEMIKKGGCQLNLNAEKISKWEC